MWKVWLLTAPRSHRRVADRVFSEGFEEYARWVTPSTTVPGNQTVQGELTSRRAAVNASRSPADRGGVASVLAAAETRQGYNSVLSGNPGTRVKMTIAEIQHLVLASLRAVLEEGDVNPQGLGPETRLIRRDAVLDSLGLVALIVDVEDRLRADRGVAVVLADDAAMSSTRSPFRTVQSLSEYVLEAVEGRGR